MNVALFVLSSILTWVRFAHCQGCTEVLITDCRKFINASLKGVQDIQQQQNEMMNKLNGYVELLQKIPEMEKKLDRVENNLQELHRDLDHVKGAVNKNQESLQNFHHELEHVKGAVNNSRDSLQNFHHELEHVKGAVNNSRDSLQNIWEKLETLEGIHLKTKDCLGREDLESFKNISSAGQQELESSLRQEIYGVISLLETGGIDECSEGSHNCGDHEACTDKFVNFTCSCLPGFARDDSRCEDIDECARGKAGCSPQAACSNSVGSYSCSCNPPFEGDGRTCSCPPGFAENGSNCDDIDECAQGKGECSPHAACSNSVGNYSCSCDPPFEGDGKTCCPPGFAQNGSNCEDIDECSQEKPVCSPHAACRNTVGSYSCSCNPPFEGDGRTCEFSCDSSARFFKGLGCVRLVEEPKSWQDMNATCQEAGWRLLQSFTVRSVQGAVRAFSTDGWLYWIGVYEEQWLESRAPLQEELWVEDYRTDPSRRCGTFEWDASSLYKVAQRDCSERRLGYCQLLL